MKRFSAVVLFFAALFGLSSAAFAAGKDTVTIPNAVTVGSVTVAPGEYDLMWTGDAGAVQVTIMQGKKTLATSPARFVAGPNRYIAVESGKKDGVNVIEAIRMKNATLYFDAPASTK